MENTALKMSMINKYHALSFTDHYILGFSYKRNIYISYQDASVVNNFIKLDTASHGQGYSIRFKPSRADKVFLLTSAKLICSAEYFEDLVNNSKYNKGEILEKLVTEIEAGKKWEKDKTPFTMAGDVDINGVAYQIKFEKATFTNEKTLENLMVGTGK